MIRAAIYVACVSIFLGAEFTSSWPVPSEEVATEAKEPFPDPPVIGYADLKKGLEDQTLTLIDVRGHEPVRKRGLVEGSHHMPFALIEDAFVNLTDADFMDAYEFPRPAKPGKNVVIMCHKEGLSRRAIEILSKHGYTDLLWYRGGFVDWLANNGTIVFPEFFTETTESGSSEGPTTGEPETEVPPTTAAAGANGIVARSESIRTIDFQELTNDEKTGLSPKYVVIDVRPRELMKKSGLVPSAHLVPAADLPSAFQSLTESEFKQKYLFERPQKPGTNVVLSSYNGTGVRAAAEILQGFGYTDIILYEGGIEDWIAQGGSLVGYPLDPSSEVPVITSAELKKGLEEETLQLIDVRNSSELLTAGMIPGSRNIPLHEVVRAFKELSDEEFLREYGFNKPPVPGKNVVVSCGSGRRALRAIHLLMPLGYTELTLYEESFEGWSKSGYEFIKDGKTVSLSQADETAAVPEKLAVQSVPSSEVAASPGVSPRSNPIVAEKLDCKEELPDSEAKTSEAVLVRAIEFDEFKKLLDEGKSVLIDIRPPQDFFLDGIEGSYNIPAEDFPEVFELSTDKFKTRYSFEKPPKTWKGVIIFGSNGCQTLGTVRAIMKSGGAEVLWYVGGTDEWYMKTSPNTDSTQTTEAYSTST